MKRPLDSPSGRALRGTGWASRSMAALFSGIGLSLSGCQLSGSKPLAQMRVDVAPVAEPNAIPVVWHRLAQYVEGREEGMSDPEDGEAEEERAFEIRSPADDFLASAGELDEQLSVILSGRVAGAEDSSAGPRGRPIPGGEAGFIQRFTEAAARSEGRSVPIGFTMMALLLIREGEHRSGIRLLERALTSDPGLKAAHCLLAKAYIAMGQRSRALHHVLIVLKQDPDDAWARDLLFGPPHPRRPPKKRLYCESSCEPPSRQFSMVAPELFAPGV